MSIGFFIRIPSARWHVGRARVFTYRQVVTGHPVGPVEVVSTFTRKIKDVRRDYVEVEFELDRLAVTSAGRFMGEVDRFPGDLRRVRAKIYRDGFVQFDRMLYVVGNHLTGFELLSTRYCGGDLTGADYECLDPRSGELDFYRGRVNDTAFSNLLDLAQVGRVVPVALVPDDENLGFQYVVGYGRSSDGYYSGSFDYSSLNRFESDGTAYRLPEGPEIDGFQLSDGDTQVYESSFANETVISYASGDGQMIDLRHRAEVRYIGD